MFTCYPKKTHTRQTIKHHYCIENQKMTKWQTRVTAEAKYEDFQSDTRHQPFQPNPTPLCFISKQYFTILSKYFCDCQDDDEDDDGDDHGVGVIDDGVDRDGGGPPLVGVNWK